MLKEILFTVAIRPIISELHILKKLGLLCGHTPEEEYDYFVRHYLKDPEYQQGFFGKYPEAYRLCQTVEKKEHAFYQEITTRLAKDHEAIVQNVCHGKGFKTFKKIDLNIGDRHNYGRSVSKILLDNGINIYYKPHSLKKTICYQDIYELLCVKAGLENRIQRDCSRETEREDLTDTGKVPYLDCGDYGWEGEVKKRDCENGEQVKHYFLRMGIHLFLAYALSASDLHGENFLACGEYPVLLDFETLPGYAGVADGEAVDKQISNYINSSVVKTGILPELIWGGDGAIVSALSTGATVRTPFQMPVIKNQGTSEMYIEHEPVELTFSGCVVTCKGEVMQPLDYQEEICAGFTSAYRTYLADTSIRKAMEPFFEARTRILLHHTQQYAMHRFTSIHQKLCESTEERRKLLFEVYSNQGKWGAIRTYEAEALFRFDIPYFEADGKSTSLYDGDGKEYPNYFPCSIYDAWKKKIQEFGERDLRIQQKLIRLSLGLLQKEQGAQFYTCDQILSKEEQSILIRKRLNEIFTWFCETAFHTDEEVGWIGLQFTDTEKWNMVPIGMQLYDGISGIAVFLAAYQKEFADTASADLLEKVKRRLFVYTDMEQSPEDKNGKNGMLEGDSSIAAAYLILYEITGGMDYLRYAEKQFQKVEDLCGQSDDYMGGRAGLLLLALKLYKNIENKRYIELTKRYEKKLWEHSFIAVKGVGWKTCDGPPLAGMAHGSSGILMAYAELLRVTGEKTYKEKIRQILAYENFLYSKKYGNWLDLRVPGEIRVMNAWCHGAPGILLARMKLEEAGVQTKKDIRLAATALFTQNPGRHMCLCHGAAGNLLIMNRYLSKYGKHNQTYVRTYEALLSDLLLHMPEYAKDMVYESQNPGFMNGLAGVGYALLELYKEGSKH